MESLDDKRAFTPALFSNGLRTFIRLEFTLETVTYFKSLCTSGSQHVGGRAEGLVGISCAGEVGAEGCPNAKEAPLGAQA